MTTPEKALPQVDDADVRRCARDQVRALEHMVAEGCLVGREAALRRRELAIWRRIAARFETADSMVARTW